MNPTLAHRPLDAELTATLPLQDINLIEASAGTGKTYTISNLYLRFVLEGYPVSELLVVTFTNAATDELRGRVRARLYQGLQALRNPDSAEDDLQTLLRVFVSRDGSEALIDRLKLAVRSMDEAAIYTIHGFCQRVLSDYSMRSAQSFEQELLADDSILWQDAIRDWWRRTVYTMNPRHARMFLKATGDFDSFLKTQSALRETGDKTILPADTPTIADLLQSLDNTGEEAAEIAETWGRRREEIRQILQNSKALRRRKPNVYHDDNLPATLAVLEAWFESDDRSATPEEFKALRSSYIHSETQPTKIGTDPDLEDPFFQQCEALSNNREALRRLLKISALKKSTARARQTLEELKRENRIITYSDQLLRLRQQLEGPRGENLASALRRRFPLALVDEFQDTDPIQYAIFRRLYQRQPGTSLFLIGDPKQSIYAFRGSDIFAYIEARFDAGENRFTLETNWRSTPDLIQAVNTIFSGRESPFIFDEAIEFTPVHPRPQTADEQTDERLHENGQPVTPFTVWTLPDEDDGKNIPKYKVRARATKATAAEIARLIRAGRKGNARIADRPIRPADLCVLVRTHDEAMQVREALRNHGVAAVSTGRESIYQSAEASALLMLLQGIHECNDRRKSRAALTSALIGEDYVGLDAVLGSESAWLHWSDTLEALNRTWHSRGFMALFQSMLHRLEIGARLATQANPERRLTNLLHLAELLQQASKKQCGPTALLAWFDRQIRETCAGDTEPRLETDDALVSIMTIHASKGLEYPVVFLPFLWDSRPLNKTDKSIVYHGPGRHGFLDLGSEDFQTNLYRADRERLAEDIRLAYVALTRARSRVYMVWGTNISRQDNVSGSAAGYLLHPLYTAAELEQGRPFKAISPEQRARDLKHLQTASNGTIECRPLQDPATDLPAPESDTEGRISAAIFSGKVATDWRIASFSALTRDIHQLPHGGSPHTHSDEILDFPAGSRTGLFLHALLEQLPYDSTDMEQHCNALMHQVAPRFGFDDESLHATVRRWIRCILDTPLDNGVLRLNQLTPGQRLHELEFDLGTGSVDITALNRLLQDHSDIPLEPVQVSDFQGMVTGIIDLVFEYRNRFYIADFKSNFLGGRLDDYAPTGLRQAVFDRRYDLQYLLYTLAVHRYLRQRLPDYDLDRDFGGVYYLFLRGMRPDNPDGGIYFTRPDSTLIDALDRKIFACDAVTESQ